MPYQIEVRIRPTPQDHKLGTVDEWSVLSQSDWFPTESDALAVIAQMSKDDAKCPGCRFQYKTTFFSIAHPDPYDDQEFGS